MRPHIVLIDGNNLAHRMRHAMTEMATRNGRPTGVLYGTINTLHKVYERFDPDGIIVAWDAECKPWRRRIYKEYKANRDARRAHMSASERLDYGLFYEVQMPDTMKALSSLGIQQVRTLELEADDVIATISRDTRICDFTIVSTDKDMLQLVRHERIRIWNPVNDVLTIQAVDKAIVVGNERLAPSPKTYVLWRTIIGDSSDGVKGIDGVGEKTVKEMLPSQWNKGEPLRDYLGRCDLRGKRGQSIHDGVPIILRNLKLMDLRESPIRWAKFKEEDENLLLGKSMDTQHVMDTAKLPRFLQTERNPVVTAFDLFFARREFDFACWSDASQVLRDMYRTLYNRSWGLWNRQGWPVPRGPWIVEGRK